MICFGPVNFDFRKKHRIGACCQTVRQTDMEIKIEMEQSERKLDRQIDK